MREKPAIVQSDGTILLFVDSRLFNEARGKISAFSELIKAPDYVHTYRITPISLWNASAVGMKSEDVVKTLEEFSAHKVPSNILCEINEYMGRYGEVKMVKEEDEIFLELRDPAIGELILSDKKASSYIEEKISSRKFRVKKYARGHLKLFLVKMGYPVEDWAGYVKGTGFEFSIKDLKLRPYQVDAVEAFYAKGSEEGGSGIVVLPCGAGKTIVGIGVMEKLRSETLIIVTSTVAARQWRDELLRWTTVKPDQIGEYSGEKKEIKPITIATYNILIYRRADKFSHLGIFDAKNWGLIIYDEVHLLPAPVFRVTAEIQAKRRLGLSATLVREDGKEDEIFALIGPKKYDAPWKTFEEEGWIAEAVCFEVRVGMKNQRRMNYMRASRRRKFTIASTNPEKLKALRKILQFHRKDRVLIIGQFLSQLREISKLLNAPLITGATPNSEREKLYQEFREGKIKRLVVSKVANFAIDLPSANVAIEVSGTFGSRQEEAQRLGRILRPKKSGNAYFYSIVSRETIDEEYSSKRQIFLTEQGYKYKIINMEELNGKGAVSRVL